MVSWAFDAWDEGSDRADVDVTRGGDAFIHNLRPTTTKKTAIATPVPICQWG